MFLTIVVMNILFVFYLFPTSVYGIRALNLVLLFEMFINVQITVRNPSVKLLNLINPRIFKLMSVVLYYAFDAEKKGLVQELHQLSNQTDP